MSISDQIIYKNNQLIGLNKPSGLACQADKTGDKSLVDLAEIYTKSKLHLVHRLDRPASGIVLLAKNKKSLAHLNAQFQNRSIQKTYLAVVKNHPPEPTGHLVHFLRKNQKQNRSFATKEEVKYSKKAELQYEVISAIDNYHLLKIDLMTGRHHQIRAQLAAINCPIKGDDKYGFKRSNKDRSIHLHAWQLAFRHPVTDERVTLQAPIPNEVVWQAFEF
ncbi:MAG: RNA pseudouridine synthase [Bacteroidota bacterium]